MKRRKPENVVRRTLADGTVKTYRYARSKAPRKPRDTLDELIAAWERSPRWQALAASTKAMYVRGIRPLTKIGGTPAGDIELRDLVVIRDAIALTIGHGAATVFVRTASALFGWAVESGWLKTSPCFKLKTLPGGHHPTWSEQDVKLALAHLPEHLRRPIILALHTGQRRGDLLKMRWADYDGNSITVVQQKTGKPLVVPCHPELIAELEAWKRDPVVGMTILVNSAGRPWQDNTLSARLSQSLQKIPGLTEKANIHGLRKLAAVRLAHAGCSLHEIAAITGHESLAMVQLYTAEAQQERLAKAAVLRLVRNAGAKDG